MILIVQHQPAAILQHLKRYVTYTTLFARPDFCPFSPCTMWNGFLDSPDLTKTTIKTIAAVCFVNNRLGASWCIWSRALIRSGTFHAAKCWSCAWAGGLSVRRCKSYFCPLLHSFFVTVNACVGKTTLSPDQRLG